MGYYKWKGVSGVCAPANWTLKNTLGNTLGSGNISSGASAIIPAPNAVVTVNGGSPTAIPSGDSYNLTTDDWYRPQSWPQLYEVADDAVYFLMKFSSIHDIQPFGFRTTFATGTPKLVEIFVNGISVYSNNVTGSTFVDHVITVDGNTQSFSYAGGLWAWVKVKFTGAVATSALVQDFYLRFQNTSNLPFTPINDNWKGPNILECIFNTDKVNQLRSTTFDISGYNWILISNNIRHWHLMNTSTLRFCNFQSMSNEAVTGFGSLTSNYVPSQLFGTCPFPIQGLPTTFDCTMLTNLSNMLRSSSSLTGNPIQSTIKSMPLLTFQTSSSLTSLQNFASGQHLTGLIVTDCSGVTNTTNAIINAPNLTLLKLIGYKISFNISALGLWGAGIEEFALALGTASTSPTITMTTRQYNSFGGSGSAVESLILSKGFTIMTV